MKKQLLISTGIALGLAGVFVTNTVSASEIFAFQLGVYPTCTGCHTSQDNAEKFNVIPAANAAYKQDPWNLTGLKAYLSASSAPATPIVPIVPTCTGGQVLNAAKDGCITPAPVVPICSTGQILNATKDACVTPTPVVPTCKSTEMLNAAKTACVAKTVTVITPTCAPGASLNSTKTACVAPVVTKTNTKPVLNSVAQEWNAKVGEAFKIPLSVNDAEHDDFKMSGSVVGSKFGKVYTDAKTLLPTVDFEWTPSDKQKDKIYTITFQAKETKTTEKFVSNKVKVKIRVWAAGTETSASVSKLNISTSAWVAGKLRLSGNIVFNNLLTTQERQTFIATPLDLTIIGGKDPKSGALVGIVPLKLDAKGNWSVNLPVTKAPCDVTLQYEGQVASHTVAGCVSPVALVQPPVLLANNLLEKQLSGDDDERENDEHDDHHDH